MAIKLKRTVRIFGFLLFVMAIVLVAVVALFDPNDYKDSIVEKIEEQTGRTAVINAPLEWTLFPWLGIRAGDFSLGNRDGFGEQPFLSAKKAGARINLIPLIKGKVVVDTVVLDGGQLNLQRNADGLDNWSDLQKKMAGLETADKSEESRVESVSINGLDITSTTVNFTDEQAKSSYTATITKATTGSIDLQSPFPVDLDIALEGTNLPMLKMMLRGTIDTTPELQVVSIPDLELSLIPDGNLAGKVNFTSSINLNIPAQEIALTNLSLKTQSGGISGNLTAKGFSGIPAMQGTLDIASLSVPQLMAALGQTLPLPKGALESISGKLTLIGDTNSMELSQLDLKVDDTTLQGNVKIPSISPLMAKFDLSIDQINLDRYMPSESAADSGKASTQSGDSAIPEMAVSGGLKITRLQVAGQQLENISLELIQQGDKAEIKPLSLQALGISINGNVTLTKLFDAPAYSGAVKLGVFNPRQLLKTLQVSDIQTSDPGVLKSASGDFSFSGNANAVKMKPFSVKLDDSAISGSLTIKEFSNPAYSFALNIDKLNVDRYLPPADGSSASSSGGGDVPLKPMRQLRLNGTVGIGSLQASGMKMQRFTSNIKAGGGKITLSPMSAGLYGGSFNGTVVLNAKGNNLQWSAKEKLSKISASPFLKDLTGNDRISGKMTMDADLSGSGTSTDDVLSSVSGKASFKFTNGAVKGVNIAQALREVKAKLTGKQLAEKGEVKTDFTELAGTAVINKGIVTNNDLLAKSPFLRVGGDGTINLPQSSMDYLLSVKVVNTTKGQGGGEFKDLEGLTIPLRIKGPFSNLKYYPDIEALLKDRAKQELDKKKEELKEKAKKKLDAKLQKEKDKLKDKAKDSVKDELKEGLLKGLGL